MSETLWGSIEEALTSSASFVLLASPAAARSVWVNREVTFWRTDRERSSFYIVLTEGQIGWDEAAGDFDWAATTALPKSLSGWFDDVPLWLDVRRPPGTATRFDQRNDLLRDAARTIAAPRYGIAKDQLDGEDELESRRARRTLRAGVTALVALLVMALFAAGLAYRQYTLAVEEQRLAIARLLLPRADTLLAHDPRTALQINETAFSIHPDAETSAGLLRNLLATRYAGTLEGHQADVYALAYSPDGQTLATSGQDLSLRLWDVAHGPDSKPVGQLDDAATNSITSLSFSPDGHTLAGGGLDGAVTLWDVSDRAHPLRTGTLVSGQSGEPTSVLFTSSGVLVARVDGKVQLFGGPAANGKIHALGPALSSSEFVSDVDVDARGATLVESGATEARIWDITDPEHPYQTGSFLIGEAGTSLALSPDGRHLAFATPFYAASGAVSIWDLSDVRTPRPASTLAVPAPTTIAYAPDGRSVAVGVTNGTVQMVDVTDPQRPVPDGAPLPAQRDPVTVVTYAPASDRLAAAGGGAVTLWDNTPSRITPHLRGETTHFAHGPQYISGVAHSLDGRLLALGGDDGKILITRIDGGRVQAEAALPNGAGVTSLAFSPDERFLAVGGNDGSLTVWDIRQRFVAFHTADTGTAAFLHVAYGLDGSVLATAQSTTLVLWDVTDVEHAHRAGSATIPLQGVAGSSTLNIPVQNIAVTHNGRRLAIAQQDAQTSLWEITAADPRHLGALLQPEDLQAVAVNFAPAGTLAAVAGLTEPVVLWDVTEPQTPHRVGEPLATAASEFVEFGPDGMLVIGGREGLTLWDLTDPTRPIQIGSVPIAEGAATPVAVAFQPGGVGLTMINYFGEVTVIDLASLRPAESPPQTACELTQGGLSEDVWRQYVPVLSYRDACHP